MWQTSIIEVWIILILIFGLFIIFPSVVSKAERETFLNLFFLPFMISSLTGFFLLSVVFDSVFEINTLLFFTIFLDFINNFYFLIQNVIQFNYLNLINIIRYCIYFLAIFISGYRFKDYKKGLLCALFMYYFYLGFYLLFLGLSYNDPQINSVLINYYSFNLTQNGPLFFLYMPFLPYFIITILLYVSMGILGAFLGRKRSFF